MNLKSQIAPSIGAPLFIHLPFDCGVDVPPTKPHFFLTGFSEWLDGRCDEATRELRRLSFYTSDIDGAAVYAAKRVCIVREENDPFGSHLSAAPGDTELLADLFFHHLEIARHQHTLDQFGLLQEMALEGVWASRFDVDAQDSFEAHFGTYLEQAPDWVQSKWRASGLTRCDLIGALLRGDEAAPWYGEAAPQTGADWVREFELWLANKGFERCDLREYIPSATGEEFAAMKAAGARMSSLYLLADESESLRFLCDDPRTFGAWGAVNKHWHHFLDSERNPIWKAWRDAPSLDADAE